MDLLKRCHEKEAFSMTFPLLEPGTKYLLAYDSKDPKELRAVMALCGLGDQIFEVYAFTDPSRVTSAASGRRLRSPSRARV